MCIMDTSKIREMVTYCLEDKVNMEDFKARKLYINYEIDENLIDDIVYNILKINTEDKGVPIEERKPILLYVTSNGGSVVDGFSLIDVILNSKTPVYTINLSYQYSMGFLIGLAGVKRFATKNATYLLHDGSNFVFNSTSKVKDQLEFQNKQEQRIKDYVLSRSNLSEKEYEDKLRIEWYMYSDEAKEKGFTDFIIGEDCELDDII